MLDPKLLRESPDLVGAAIARKHLNLDLAEILTLDQRWRTSLAAVESLRARQRSTNGEMAQLPKGSDEFLAKVAALKTLKGELQAQETSLQATESVWREALLSLPNLPHDSVPEGRTSEDNVVVATSGDRTSVSAQARPHWEIEGFDNLFDFARGARTTGAGFPYYVGQGARLVRALVQFFLAEAGRAGYTEIHPPILVNAASATATGQLPDKEGQMYETVVDQLYVVPTAEVPLTNFYRDDIIAEVDLPVKRCAYTPCLRREAGSYGKDVRGLNRLHQFDKVELLKWVHPATSYPELETLRGDAENLLRQLELPYRVLSMCGGDLGFSPAKKYDLEVWSAGQKQWLEVSSCSNFEAFQSRRARIRFRGADRRPEFVHTLNGSGLAVPRVIAALLENNLQKDGTVNLPSALVPHFGSETISFA